MKLDTEKETVEFKEASSSNYKIQDAARYCAAIANEGGGSFVLGVTDKKPRKAVGTEACPNLDEAKKCLFDWLGFRIDVLPIDAPKRVLSFIIPPRPIGRAVHYQGRYEMRAGSHLRPMTWEELDRIRHEGERDFSSNILEATVSDIFCPRLIEKFRNGWVKRQVGKSLSSKIPTWSISQLLETAGLTIDGRPTYAGLILLGDERSLNRLLPQSELIYEYRDEEHAIRYQDRQPLRNGFLATADDIWDLVKKRNHSVPYAEGLFKYSLPAFDEESVREAICNAVSHRDYRHDTAQPNITVSFCSQL